MAKDLDGKIVGEMHTWENNPTFHYAGESSFTSEMKEINERRKALAEQHNTEKNKLDALIEAFINKSLPAGFSIRTFEYKNDRIYFRATIKGLDVIMPEAPQPLEISTNTEAPQPDPYRSLAGHPYLKSILNSGILTREEKRKVLGLPDEQVSPPIEINIKHAGDGAGEKRHADPHINLHDVAANLLGQKKSPPTKKE